MLTYFLTYRLNYCAKIDNDKEYYVYKPNFVEKLLEQKITIYPSVSLYFETKGAEQKGKHVLKYIKFATPDGWQP